MRDVAPFAAPAAALRCELQVACAQETTPRMFHPLEEQVWVWQGAVERAR
jgi:hypothetical protein